MTSLERIGDQSSPGDELSKEVTTTLGQARNVYLPARNILHGIGEGRVNIGMRPVREWRTPGGENAGVVLQYQAEDVRSLVHFEGLVGARRQELGYDQPLRPVNPVTPRPPRTRPPGAR